MPDRLKVALVGVYPPPIGGVSIHIQRLQAGCLDNGIQCTVVDVSRRPKKATDVLNIIRISDWPRILFSRPDIVHIHTTDMHWKMPALFFCLARLKGSRTIISYHSLRDIGEFSATGRMMMRLILKSCSRCIAINADIRDKLLAMGTPRERLTVIPSFLPPVVKEEEIATIPRETRDFLVGHRPVISANAYSLVQYRGEDLYGVDMCIELCAALKRDYPGVGLVFCLPRVGDSDYFAELQLRVSEKHLEGNFLFQTKPCQFYPVLMKSDIFVRPTNTDGDAVSLREALYLKIPSVASDAAPRPAGTMVFKSRDTAEFIDRVRTVREHYADYKARLESLEMPGTLDEILTIYRSAAGREAGVP